MKKIALQHVQILFQRAEENIHDRPDLSQKYVEYARKIAMRTRLHLPRQYRTLACRHCKKFIFPGVSSRVRVQPKRESHVVITCLHCGKHMRILLKRKTKE